MDLLRAVQIATNRAFSITQQFQAQVTFQLQIVWQLDPINDITNPVPSFTKTVMAIVYKPVLKRVDTTAGWIYTEALCVQQWTDDTPAPSTNDRVLIPADYPNGGGTFLRQIVSVDQDPAKAQWTILTRLPTQN